MDKKKITIYDGFDFELKINQNVLFEQLLELPVEDKIDLVNLLFSHGEGEIIAHSIWKELASEAFDLNESAKTCNPKDLYCHETVAEILSTKAKAWKEIEKAYQEF